MCGHIVRSVWEVWSHRVVGRSVVIEGWGGRCGHIEGWGGKCGHVEGWGGR